MNPAPAPIDTPAGRVAFVTGGSSGIGLGIVRAFVEAGMRVAFSYRSAVHLDEAMAALAGFEDRVLPIELEVTDRDAVAAAAATVVRELGDVHVLVNNAGIILLKPIAEASPEDWDAAIGVNLTGVYNGIHAFLPHLRRHGQGAHIVSTSSVMGLYSTAGRGLYSAAKFGLVGLSESLRAELKDEGIGVSVYCPGYVMQRGDGDPLRAMDPLEAGRLVLRGILRNDPYILTHPEFDAMFDERMRLIRDSYPRGPEAPAERVAQVREISYNPTYAEDAARLRTLAGDLPDAPSYVYRTAGDAELRVWHAGRPTAPGVAPAMCFFYGGAWIAGTPLQFAEHARYLASRGMSVFLADYRVTSRHGSTVVDSIDDARAAIAWIADNAGRLGIDPERIAAGGGSSGGYLAAAAAMLPDPAGDARPAPHALVLFNPSTDLRRVATVGPTSMDAPGQPFHGVDLDRYSLARRLRAGLPPAIVLHGRADATIPFESIAEFVGAARALGNRWELVGYDDQAHGFFNHPGLFSGVGGWQYVATLRRVDEFLTDLGWLSGPPTLTADPRIAV